MLESDNSASSRKKWVGTQNDSYFWCNTTDSAGLGFATFVWVMILYAASVTILVVVEGDMAVYNGAIILTLVVLALWAHLKTMMGDPGAVPSNAHPLAQDSETGQIVCGRCECYKPPGSHHGNNIKIE